MNHYATGKYFNESGRHYWFAKFLKEKGYNPFVFTSNTYQENQKAYDFKGKFIVKDNNKDNIPFVFVKTSKYKGNKLGRIRNMFQFFRRLFTVTKKGRENLWQGRCHISFKRTPFNTCGWD